MSEHHIGIIGDAPIDPENAKALLSDYIAAHSKGPNTCKFVFVFTEEHFAGGAQTVLEVVRGMGQEFDIVVGPTGDIPESLTEAADGAVFEYVSDNPPLSLAEVIVDEQGVLMALLGPDQSDAADNFTVDDAIEAVLDAGLPAFDLASNLLRLEFDPAEDVAPVNPEDFVPESEEDDPDKTKVTDVIELPEQPWTEDDLKGLNRVQLEKAAEAFGIEVKKGMWAKTLIASILDAQAAAYEEYSAQSDKELEESGLVEAELPEERPEPEPEVSEPEPVVLTPTGTGTTVTSTEPAVDVVYTPSSGAEMFAAALKQLVKEAVQEALNG